MEQLRLHAYDGVEGLASDEDDLDAIGAADGEEEIATRSASPFEDFDVESDARAPKNDGG